MKLDVIGKSKIWFALSGVLIIASIVAVFVYGLNWGIDFTGGSLLDVTFEQEVNNDQIKQVLNNVNVNGLVQASGDSYLIKMSPLSQDEHDMVIGALRDNLGELQENRFDSIGPVIGQELKDKSIEAIVLLLVLIVLYVAWAFRKVSEPVSSWKYGLLTIVAAMHDIIIPIGAFAVLGYFYGYEIDTAFVAALLT
ncbi:protein translocase subunit SecF, partial [Candidatus Parcubacteria bacterium]